VFLVYGGMGTFMMASARRSQDQTVGGVMLVIGLFAAVLVLVFSAFYAFSGWKLYKQQQIGRTLGIVASILCLMNFPLGTALGVYGLWFLLGEEGKRLYLGGMLPAHHPPPPPNSWR